MSHYAGIIGTGVNAAIWYYETIQTLAKKAGGENAVFPVKLLSIPFEPINNLLPHQMRQAGEWMLPYFKEMQNMGVAHFILANITLHEAMDIHRTKSPQWIHIREIFEQYWKKSRKTAMIIGTDYTMKSGYIPSLLPKSTKIIRASPEDQQCIDRVRRHYYAHPVADAPDAILLQLPQKYPEVDAFVISCTEHALALKGQESTGHFFNLPALQCYELFKKTSASLGTS